HVIGALTEVKQDRAGLAERAPVVEDQRRNPERRVVVAEQLATAGAIEHVDLATLVLDPELGEQQPDLVAVARDGRVVEEHQRRIMWPGAAGCMGDQPAMLSGARS